MNCDVVVVGGGLLGAAAAYHLASAGASVLLLERDQLGLQASGQNAGSLHFQLEYRMFEHGAAQAEQNARALPLHVDAARAWGELEERVGEPAGVVRSGGLMLAGTSEQADFLARKADLETGHGLPIELLDGPALRTVAPYLSPRIVAAALCPVEGKADPRRVTHVYARAARRHGALIRTGARVTGLVPDGGRWRVTVAAPDRPQRISARQVLIAAGVWTGEVAQLADVRLPVVPVALTMSVTERARPFLPHLVQHAGRRLSMKQTAEGNVLIGGGWPATLVARDGRVDLSAGPRPRLDSIRGNAAAALVVPQVAALRLLRVWTGTTALLPDQLPLLGEIPRRPGLYVATGGSAFTLGPTYARLMAGMLAGERPDLPVAEYAPARFGHLTFG
ncbi:NAD(P)/FAD-dependent oxidoreductase [Spongiactinospora sp. 9N601]|uniref:NAD(P)/FAD-dependent oxidoreductase n=1 Tax=Spongiactinospora sp. 9N601 TaxID=3375149 RepID=UPI003797B0B7